MATSSPVVHRCAGCCGKGADEPHLGEYWHRKCYLRFLGLEHDLRPVDLGEKIDFSSAEVWDAVVEYDDEDRLLKPYERGN